MKKETFPGYELITYDDGTYGYVMADGTSKQGYKSKDGAKKAAKKLATALQVTPYTLTDIEQALADELSALYDDAAKYLVDKAKNFVSVLPAHAGMIPPLITACTYAVRAPRACGDDPHIDRINTSSGMCSPRMRG